jgi:transposase-like protein
MVEVVGLKQENPFKGRQYKPAIILLCVRWYLRYSLSYRDLEEMMVERGLHIDHTTIYRWVQCYAPQLEKRTRLQRTQTNDCWRGDETYIKVRGSAEYFFRQLLRNGHTVTPRIINVDIHPSYRAAFKTLQKEGVLDGECELRPVKYLNNIIEQDHRFIKRRVKPGLGFARYRTAWATLQGYEAMNQLRKGQVAGTSRVDILSQVRFIHRAFGVAG